MLHEEKIAQPVKTKRHFPGVKAAEWNDWRWQNRNRIRSLAQLDRMISVTDDERAAIEVGVEPVWQLDGGLLKYFEVTGGRHFEGRCFVFDERESVDTTLQPARSV